MSSGSQLFLAALVGTALALSACGKEDDDEKTAEPAHAASPQESDGSIALSAEQQSKAGIQVKTLEVREQSPELRAFAQVLDPQPLLEALGEVRSATAAAAASEKEYTRTKALHDSDLNASARTLEAAQAAMERDEAQLQAAQAKLTSGWSPALLNKARNANFGRALTSLDAALLRVDLPLGEPLPSAPKVARVQSVADVQNFASAALLGPATSSNAQMPGQSFLYLLQPNTLGLRPGMSTSVALTPTGTPERGVIAPRDAIIRHQGRAWIYVQVDPQKFQRREVSLDQLTAEGWFLPGADASKAVVVAGAQVLLSEELKSQIRLGD